MMLGPLKQDVGTIGVLTLPADNGTWSVTLTASSKDVDLRALRHPETWERVNRLLPLTAHWIDAEQLEDGVTVMAKIEDRDSVISHREEIRSPRASSPLPTPGRAPTLRWAAGPPSGCCTRWHSATCSGSRRTPGLSAPGGPDKNPAPSSNRGTAPRRPTTIIGCGRFRP